MRSSCQLYVCCMFVSIFSHIRVILVVAMVFVAIELKLSVLEPWPQFNLTDLCISADWLIS